MSDVVMYLRANKSGAILPYNDRLAKNPGVTLVTEREAFPERFAPVKLEERKSAINISVPDEVVNVPPNVSPELIADASRGFDTPKATRVRRKEAAPSTFDVAGLGDF